MYKLGRKSKANLEGVNPSLVGVVLRAIELTRIDFSVVEGVRSKERQAGLVKSGKSTTMKSRHLTGHAVDIYPWVDGKTSHDEKHYKMVARAMFRASQELSATVSWGGLWVSFIDNPHWQLDD